MSKKPKFTIAPSDYQPSKAELHEKIKFPSGTTPEKLAAALFKTSDAPSPQSPRLNTGLGHYGI